MIVLQNVHKNFGSFKAIESANIHVMAGDIYGIVGTSGAGKSTLLRLMNALDKPDEGDIIFDGKSVHTLTNKQLRLMRQSLGVIFQSHYLIQNKTVYNNVSVPLEIAKVPRAKHEQKILESLRFVGLEHLRQQYPAQLSGGQKQRVAIARAIVNDPKVLLCDEPTSSLDPHTTIEILKLLKRVNKELNMTIVIVSHEMSVIKSLCERVAVIDDGKVFDVLDIQPTGIEEMNRGAAGLIEQLKDGGGSHLS